MPGEPRSGSKVRETLDREIGKPGQSARRLDVNDVPAMYQQKKNLANYR